MNDVHVAVEENEESMEARDFVDLGEVSEDTKGSTFGHYFDGGGYWG